MENNSNDYKIITKKFLFLFIGIIVASFGVIPYATDLLSKLPKDSVGLIPPDFVIGLLFVIQLSITAIIGLVISKQLNFGTLVLESIVTKKDIGIKWKSFILSSIFIGIIIGSILLLSDYIFYKLGASLTFFNADDLPSWYNGLIGSFFGGIGEEIIFRLFFMSLLIYLLNLIIRNKDKTPKTWTVWTAMVFIAIVFGLAHLPLTESLSALTTLVVIRAILLNSIGGIGFGFLYWKKGLLYAMIAHFFADITLHVIAVSIFG